MLQLLVMAGPFGILLVLMALVVLGLSVKKAIDLFGASGRGTEGLRRGLNAILFWGAISAVLGFLGQYSALYKSMMIISRAPVIDPALVSEGIAVSLLSTLMGLIILVLAAIVWFVLKTRLDRLSAPDGGRAGA